MKFFWIRKVALGMDLLLAERGREEIEDGIEGFKGPGLDVLDITSAHVPLARTQSQGTA